MESFFRFVNAEKKFLHPVVKASVLHFLIGYIHPFKDGNGRVARSLFYWYMLKKGYHFLKNVSLSKMFKSTRIQYDKAFLKVESDQNDMTYFILYSLKSLQSVLDDMTKRMEEKSRRREVRYSTAFLLTQNGFSKRQANLLAYMYVKNKETTLQEYIKFNEVSRVTARKELSDLVKKGILKEEKRGRDIFFTVISKKAIVKYL